MERKNKMYELKTGDIISGFKVTARTEIPDVAGVLYEMEYPKNGAKLVFIDREDENKTFSVGFKTIPTDSTGVFHIIEHSVLCGSEKFPVKEPFVELLKSSLQTFLNAMTFPDKTIYPTSSRNEKDFLNLMEIYLDAVFCPSMIKNKSVFLQEGWHKEFDENGKLSYNGVVYNEMKGAYSSPEELGETVINKKLYGDSTYGYDSGGCPDNIPDLTYEQFVASHKKFYHPSNAYFFLDGAVLLESALPLIESYVSRYERLECDFSIEDGWSGKTETAEIEYEISAEEGEENKSRELYGFLSTRFDELLDSMALDIAIEAIAGGIESPLQKVILASGLCEKMSINVNNSRLRNNITLEFSNVKDGKGEELYSLFRKTLSEIVAGGINREHLTASMNRQEFTVREMDLGGLPRGIAYNISVFDSWLYGGAPARSLLFGEDFKELRKRLDGEYFEDLIKKYILENERYTHVIMRPSATLGERRLEEERIFFERESARLTEEEKESIQKEFEALSKWQNEPNSEEAGASIPTLEISDIPESSDAVPMEIASEDGVEIIRHDMKTGGISYTELFFDASDFTEDEMAILPLFVALIKSSGTKDLSSFSFQNKIKRELGALTLAPVVYNKNGETRLYAKLAISVLDSKKREYEEILKEFLYETTLSDRESFKNIVRQVKLMLTTAFASSGNAYGSMRAMAYRDTAHAVRDKIAGYGFFEKIREIEANLDTVCDEIIERINLLRDKLFLRERLTLAFAGDGELDFEKSVIATVREGGAKPSAVALLPLGVRDEGIAIPAQVGFGVMASALSEVGEELCGAMLVAKTILEFEYLWCEVRVKGGAYGVSLRLERDGGVVYSSYRDPSPEASLGVFARSSAFLREFASTDIDIKRYIIGAMGEFEPYLSVPAKASISTSYYLSGYGEERNKRRAEILATTAKELVRVAEVFERLEPTLVPLLVAPKEKINAKTVLSV